MQLLRWASLTKIHKRLTQSKVLIAFIYLVVLFISLRVVRTSNLLPAGSESDFFIALVSVMLWYLTSMEQEAQSKGQTKREYLLRLINAIYIPLYRPLKKVYAHIEQNLRADYQTPEFIRNTKPEDWLLADPEIKTAAEKIENTICQYNEAFEKMRLQCYDYFNKVCLASMQQCTAAGVNEAEIRYRLTSNSPPWRSAFTVFDSFFNPASKAEFFRQLGAELNSSDETTKPYIRWNDTCYRFLTADLINAFEGTKKYVLSSAELKSFYVMKKPLLEDIAKLTKKLEEILYEPWN